MKIKGILIDVVKKEVREVKIEQGLIAIYEILQCELIEVARQQEAYLIKLRESLEQKKSNLQNSKTYQYERAKLIGMMDMLDVIKIDRSEFNWIF